MRDWPEGWEEVTSPTLVVELEREMRKGHVLHGRPIRTVGRRSMTDDVLYELEDTGEFAFVQLTWADKKERLPRPWTEIFPTFEAWAEAERAHSSL